MVRILSSWDRPGRRAKGGLQRATSRGQRTGNPDKKKVRCHSLARLYASMNKQKVRSIGAVDGRETCIPVASEAQHRLWRTLDPTTGTCRSTPRGHSDWFTSVAFSPRYGNMNSHSFADPVQTNGAPKKPGGSDEPGPAQQHAR